MASQSVLKAEPVDKRKYSALIVADPDAAEPAITTKTSLPARPIRQPRRNRQSAKMRTAQDTTGKAPEVIEPEADDADTRGRKRTRREENKHVAKHGVVDLTTEEELDETWATMHRELSAGPHAKKLKPSLDAWQQRELRNLEIDFKPKWYAPNTFFSRPARKHNKRSSIAEPSRGQISHPAIHEAGDNQFRRSERNVQKHIAESSRPSRIEKSKKKKKAASTIGKKLNTQNIQKGIARGQAQIVGDMKQEGQKNAGVEELKDLHKKANRKLRQNEGKAATAPSPFKSPGTVARKASNAGGAHLVPRIPAATSRGDIDGLISATLDRNRASGLSMTLSIRSRMPAFDR